MYDQTSEHDAPFRLRQYELVSKSPISDPLRVSRSTVEAPSQHEALEYLIDTAGWRCSPERRFLLIHNYDFVETSQAPRGRGMSRAEWTNATLLGYLPHPVSLVEGALVGPAPPTKPLKTELATGSWRFFSTLESFFRRQENYPRTWKAIGMTLVIGVGLGLLYLLWQLLLCLATVYIVARAVMAGIRD